MGATVAVFTARRRQLGWRDSPDQRTAMRQSPAAACRPAPQARSLAEGVSTPPGPSTPLKNSLIHAESWDTDTPRATLLRSKLQRPTQLRPLLSSPYGQSS